MKYLFPLPQCHLSSGVRHLFELISNFTNCRQFLKNKKSQLFDYQIIEI